MRILDEDQNHNDERTFGVQGRESYIVVTENKQGELRSLVLSGISDDDEQAEARALVADRIARESEE